MNPIEVKDRPMMALDQEKSSNQLSFTQRCAQYPIDSDCVVADVDLLSVYCNLTSTFRQYIPSALAFRFGLLPCWQIERNTQSVNLISSFGSSTKSIHICKHQFHTAPHPIDRLLPRFTWLIIFALPYLFPRVFLFTHGYSNNITRYAPWISKCCSAIQSSVIDRLPPPDYGFRLRSYSDH